MNPVHHEEPEKRMTVKGETGTPTRVKVGQAKGRPMLGWVGKHPLRELPVFPAQEVERFALEGSAASAVDWSDWPTKYPQNGLLFHGENKEVLVHLIANGLRARVDLVYIDPPFDSGADYVRRVSLRGPKGTAQLDGEGYTLGEQIQYTDIWANDTYLQFMYERLLLLKELLSPTGAIYVHCDTKRSYVLRAVLDEIFGADGFRNEIIWQRTTAHADTRGRFGEIHDSILAYALTGTPVWNEQHLPYSETYLGDKYGLVEDGSRRRYRLGDMTAPGPRPNLEYEWHGLKPPPGRCWAVNRDRMEEYEAAGRLVYSRTGMPQYKRYLDEMAGVPVQDIWTDISPVNPMAEERLGYPTQKPEALVDRIVRASSNPGGIVLDCFVGSGTTAAVAQKLGRRWIACDINKGAIQTTAKRLVDVVREQAAATSVRQTTLDGSDGGVEPAQLAFTTYRVNDYDLAIQHNEAVELACEALGVQRSRTDAFFDGALGRQLVKILPFDHPASPLDIDAVVQELRNRPAEDRDITIVSLGKETACDARLAEHNRRGAPNKITLVELRSDPKYGKFFAHQAASAEVHLERTGEQLRVVIDDFLSPTIVERLGAQEGIVAPRITDWRMMVDSILIDPAYEGTVFRIGTADVPDKKTDFVAGTYELDPATTGAMIAVKITDMLGEEILLILDAGGPETA
jgi:adenine-specific DNA-methyltransferase